MCSVDTKAFLVFFLKFSGFFEMFVAVLFLFMGPLLTSMSIPNRGFFEVFSGVTFIVLGFLLYFSARDIARYLVIPVTSCVFRYAMVAVEFYGMIAIPPMLPMFIFGFSYDIFSATLTLWLLKKCGFFTKK